MKVMLVNGSSHLHGTTMAALEEMIKVFHSEEVETEVVQLGGKPIADCLQCNVCQKTGNHKGVHLDVQNILVLQIQRHLQL